MKRAAPPFAVGGARTADLGDALDALMPENIFKVEADRPGVVGLDGVAAADNFFPSA